MFVNYNISEVLPELKSVAGKRLDSKYNGKGLCQVDASKLFWFCFFVEQLIEEDELERIATMTHLEYLAQREEDEKEAILSAVDELFGFEAFLAVKNEAEKSLTK